jgi:hypothetical protein
MIVQEYYLQHWGCDMDGGTRRVELGHGAFAHDVHKEACLVATIHLFLETSTFNIPTANCKTESTQ